MNWKKLFKVLREMGVPAYIADLVKSLYEFNSKVARVDGEESKAFRAEQWVRQGCVLFPKLFNIYGEHIIRKAPEHWTVSISSGERRISDLRYADDTTLTAPNEKEMVELVNLVKMANENLELSTNPSKMKVMMVNPGQMSSSFYSSERVRKGQRFHIFRFYNQSRRTPALTRLRNVPCNKKTSRKIRKRLIRSLVSSVFPYGAGT